MGIKFINKTNYYLILKNSFLKTAGASPRGWGGALLSVKPLTLSLNKPARIVKQDCPFLP